MEKKYEEGFTRKVIKMFNVDFKLFKEEFEGPYEIAPQMFDIFLKHYFDIPKWNANFEEINQKEVKNGV